MSDHEMLNQAGLDQNWSQQKLRFNFTLEIFTPDTQTGLSSNIWTQHSGLNAAHQQKCPKDNSNLAPNNRPIVLFCLFSAYFESKTNSAKWQRDTETSKDDKEHKRKGTQSRNSHPGRHKETRKTFVMLSNEMQNVGGTKRCCSRQTVTTRL